ncbi:MAG: hypothetical protein H8D78_05510, partial [Chloroflexi bacterium]|nr:hypothetical protein [Chloroflexota bacterium]
MFAEVVVNDPLSRLSAAAGAPSDTVAPLGMTYHYDVPPHLRGVLRPGHLAWVGFGQRRLQGIVVGLSETAPVAETRPLERLVLDEPVLTDRQLALARWMSAHYLAPLLDCTRLMLPPGLLRAAEPLLEARLAPPFPSDLTPEQADLLTRLQEGPIPLRRLKRTAPRLAARAVIEPLRQRGLVSRRQAVVRPPLCPKIGRRVRLLADAGKVARALPTLGHGSKQADVLSWLAASDDPLPTLAAVCQAVGCTEGPVRALAERGWVEITPRRRLLVPLLSSQAIDEALVDMSRQASKQATVLAALRDASGPVDEASFRAAHGVSANVLRALAERGWIEITARPRLLVLLLSSHEIDEVLASELQRAPKQAAALTALRDVTGPVDEASFRAAHSVSASMLRALAKRGWVEITPRRRLLKPLLSPQAVDETLMEEVLCSSEQAAALAALRDVLSPVEETTFRAEQDVSAAALRALEERGFVRRVDEEPKVLLRLEPEEVAERIVELRGASKHRAVLEALLELADEVGEGEPVIEWIGWVYAETGCDLNTLRDLEAAGLMAIEEEEIWRDPLAGREFVTDVPPKLTPDQARVWSAIEPAVGRLVNWET